MVTVTSGRINVPGEKVAQAVESEEFADCTVPHLVCIKM